eukprot:1248465-Rhodomonas_salina.1
MLLRESHGNIHGKSTSAGERHRTRFVKSQRVSYRVCRVHARRKCWDKSSIAAQKSPQGETQREEGDWGGAGREGQRDRETDRDRATETETHPEREREKERE